MGAGFYKNGVYGTLSDRPARIWTIADMDMLRWNDGVLDTKIPCACTRMGRDSHFGQRRFTAWDSTLVGVNRESVVWKGSRGDM